MSRSECFHSPKWAGLALAAGLLLSACEDPPGIAEPLNSQKSNFFGVELYEVRDDNPRLAGFVDPTPLQWEWAWPSPDITRSDSTQQAYGGSEGVRINASEPVFNYGMKTATSPFGVPAGASVQAAYVPRLLSRFYPWVMFPADCQSTSDTACRQLDEKDQTLPWFAGSMSLTPARGVQLRFNRVFGEPSSSGSTWQTREQLIHQAAVVLDTETLVVPVHFHVFLDPQGGSRGYTGAFAGWDTRARAEAIQDLVDFRLVGESSAGIFASNTEWGISQNAKLREPLLTQRELDEMMISGLENIEEKHQTLSDSLFGRCGVQLQVKSVRFIRQPDGLEDKLDCSKTIDTGCDEPQIRKDVRDCSALPTRGSDGDYIYRVGPYFDATLRGPASKRALHFFVGGKFSNSVMNGKGCPADTDEDGTPRPPFGIIQAGLRYSFELLVAHETTHMLGLFHNDTDIFLGDQEGDVEPLCNTIRRRATALLAR